MPECPFWNGYGRNLTAESRMYEFHDPFPDEKSGPHTEYRPRGFMQPRTDTRRDFDLRLLLSMSSGSPGPLYSKGQPARTLVSPIAPAVPIQAAQPVMPVSSSPALVPTSQSVPTENAGR